jgi:hypothetical protein
MRTKSLIISITIFVLVSLAAYLLVSMQVLQNPGPVQSHEQAPKTIPEPISTSPEVTRQIQTTKQQTADIKTSVLVGNKLLEVFGRITDQDNRPIENVFISEERYFYNTRSDAQGNFRIQLDIPVNRYPILHFLRSGYRGQRIKLQKLVLQQRDAHELNISLADAYNTVSLRGRVGNDIGLNLEGARVELVLSEASITETYYMTVFTDPNGAFEFEGVLMDKDYTFSVNLTPDYPVYQDPELHVSESPQQINVVLNSLKFVDVSGMILNRQSFPVPNFEINISNLSTGAHSRKIVSDSSGFFTLAGFPLGEVNLSTRGPQFYKITGLVLSEAQYSNLTLIVDQGDYYLSGWVSDENGGMLEKALVTLDSSYHDGPVEYQTYRSQGTDSNGRFSFDNLGSGEHNITVYAYGFEKQVIKHHFQAQSDELQIELKIQN